MKKLLSIMCASVAAVAVGSSLVACGGGVYKGERPSNSVDHTLSADLGNVSVSDVNDPVADTSTDKVGACTITVWAPEGAINGYKELANEFTTTYKGGKYSNVTIDFQAKPEGEVETALATDATQGADVFFFEQGQISNMVSKNLLQPLQGSDFAVYSKAISERDVESSYSSVVYNGYCYAFPTTADNGWFLWYDSSFYSEKDVQSLDTMVEKAKKANKNIMFDYGNGWYLPSFWQGIGCVMDYGASGEYVINVDSEDGKDVATTVYNLLGVENNKMANGSQCIIKPSSDMNSEIPAGLKNGTLAAGFIGTWVATDMPETAKPAKCPTFKTASGKTVQMGSFMGGKYCGVNPQRANTVVSAALANYLTNEKGQTKRFDATEAGPTNKNVQSSSKVQNNAALAALAEQNAAGGYSQESQTSGFWDAWAAFGNGIAAGTITSATLDTELANLITAVKA